MDRTTLIVVAALLILLGWAVFAALGKTETPPKTGSAGIEYPPEREDG